MKKLSFLVILLIICVIIIISSIIGIEIYEQIQSEGKKVWAEREISDNELELYDGKIYNIFFHSLIIDTNKAFNSKKSEGYNYWMTTREEFLSMLPLLYKNDFILIDVKCIARRDKNGIMQKNELYLPKGKKPLILSIDDVNYYKYMKNDGFADRLAIDSTGNITTVVKKGDKEYYDNMGDVIPILDDFIKKHPDFSYKGAKGIVAVTGYEGVFGYNVNNLKGEELKQAQHNIKKIADRLNATGWRIACHSYSHSTRYKKGTITADEVSTDLKKWKERVGAIVGQTDIFIAPFGCSFKSKDERMKAVLNMGYYYYFTVGKGMNIRYYGEYMELDRLNLDGLTLIKYPERISKYFFNPTKVVDSSRPSLA